MSENTNTERDYPELPNFDSGDESIWEAIFNWQTAQPGADAHRKSLAVEAAIISTLHAYVDEDRKARASLSLPAAGQEPVADDEWKVRGYLAKTLKCWHRLTDEEAAELVAMTQRLAGLYPAPRPAPPTEQQAYDMGAKGAPATDAERLLFEAWMRGHCWALCATWDGKCYRSDAEQNGNIDPRAMNTRQLWGAWRDRAALAAPQPAVAAGWVSVKDRLPPPYTEVLIYPRPTAYCCEGEVDTQGQWDYDEYETGFGNHHIKCNVTHWMPLPPAPSTEGEARG